MASTEPDVTMENIKIKKIQSSESWTNQTNAFIKMENCADNVDVNVNYRDENGDLSDTSETSLAGNSADLEFLSEKEEELSEHCNSSIELQNPQESIIPSGRKRRKSNNCEESGDIFERPDLLKEPHNGHLGSKAYNCHMCKKTFVTDGALQIHLKRHMGTLPHKCTMCERTFASPSALRLHQNRHLGIRPHKCTTCNYAFVTNSELSKHMLSHTTTTEKMHKLNQQLTSHKSTSCEASFCTPDELSKHLESDEDHPHSNKETNSISSDDKQCDKCEKTFATEASLINHKRVHPNIYKCNTCDATFSIKVRFDDHVNSHLGIKPHKCYICGKAFVYSSYLKVHIKQHMGKLQHQCTMCERSFVTPFSLREHMNRHMGIKPHKCTICDQAFVTAYELKSHMRSHLKHCIEDGAAQFFVILEHDTDHDSNIAIQADAQETSMEGNVTQSKQEEFTSNPDINGTDMNPNLFIESADKSNVLQRQATDFKDENFNLQTTGDVPELTSSQLRTESIFVGNEKTETGTSEGNIFINIESHNDNMNYTDDNVDLTESCESPFTQNNLDLESHSVEGENLNSSNFSDNIQEPQESPFREHNESQSYKCNQCDHSFTSADRLKFHLILHSGTKVYECQICKKIFVRNSCLKRHVKTHMEELPFKCTWCDRSFSESSSLRSHENRHLGIKPYKCTSSKCEHAFVTRYELNRHLKTHLNRRPTYIPIAEDKAVECYICKKSFACEAYLRRHLKRHMSRFNCDLCDARFDSLDQLKVHHNVHLGMEQHDCHLCNKSFTQRKVLKRHLAQHIGNLPYKCSVCEKSYAFVSELKEHENRHIELNPHKCASCEEAFPSLCDLRSHLKTHLDSDPLMDNQIGHEEDNATSALENRNDEVEPLDDASLEEINSETVSKTFSIIFMEDQQGVLKQIEHIDLVDDEDDVLITTPGSNEN